MKNKILKFAGASLVLAMLLACGNGASSQTETVDSSLFPITYEASEKGIEGGTFKIGIVSSTSFKGILNEALYSDNADNELLSPISAPLFLAGEDFKLTDDGLASLKVDVDKKEVTVTLREGLKWDDGEPLTIDDYIFTYKIVADKDYTGVRYDENIQKVIGIEDYHNGKSDKITGLEKINDLEVKIHLSKISPEIYTGGSGLITYIIPEHHLKDIPVKDLEKSDQVRKNPVGAGEFKVVQVIPGESIEYAPNEYYYLGKSKVDKLIIKIVPDSSVIASIKSGEYDVYKDVLGTLYPEYKEFDNIETLGRASLYYQYLGFNLGKWDESKGENVTDKNAKMYDINLRKAIAYGVNVEEITEVFYNGLRERANSPIPPAFEKLHSSETRYTYNPEKAKELLETAGYKDVDGDGIREDKNGKPFEISFAFPGMGDISEPLSQKIIQDLQEIGLKVVLTTGRIMEGNSFFDKVKANDSSIDMWIAAWGVGSSLDISGLYGKSAPFNFSRLVSEKNNELMAKVSSEESLRDPEYRAKALREWEENYMNNELGFLPIAFKYELLPVNKRVKFYSHSYNQTIGLGTPTQVTQAQPIMSTK